MTSGPLPPKPRWGIVGPGEIARVFVRALAKYDLGSIEVVYGRCSDRRGAFCREFGGRPMETLEGLLQPAWWTCVVRPRAPPGGGRCS